MKTQFPVKVIVSAVIVAAIGFVVVGSILRHRANAVRLAETRNLQQ